SQAVTLAFSVQRAGVNAEDFRGLVHAGGGAEDAPNMLGLQLFKRCEAAYFDAGPGRRSDLRRQVCETDLRLRTQDDGALDDVTQLTDVSRPGITQKSIPYFLPE